MVDLYEDGIGNVELVHHDGTDLTVVNSARVSFGKQKLELQEKDKKLINYLIEHKHTSVLEHCSVTFRIKVPLFVARQHMRHRTWSYNEISRRYTDFDIRFYEPKQLRIQHQNNRQASSDEYIKNPVVRALVQGHHESSLELYEWLLTEGVCREQARGILPQNMYTEYYATANLNNILKFIDLRLDESAQWEIQKVAETILNIIEKLYPITVEAYRKL